MIDYQKISEKQAEIIKHYRLNYAPVAYMQKTFVSIKKKTKQLLFELSELQNAESEPHKSAEELIKVYRKKLLYVYREDTIEKVLIEFSEKLISNYASQSQPKEQAKMTAQKFLELKGIFSLDTKKRTLEVYRWMEEYHEYASQSQLKEPSIPSNKFKQFLKDSIKNKTYQTRFHIPCDFPQEKVDEMIDESFKEFKQ